MADNKKETTVKEKETKVAVAKPATAVKAEEKKVDTAIEKEAESVKTEEVKKAPAKTAAKAAPKKKAATTRTTAKKTEEKAAPKETAKTSTKSKIAKVYLEIGDHPQISQEDLIKKIIEKWVSETGKKETAIKSFNVYIKPEDNAAYYVINEQGSSIELF